MFFSGVRGRGTRQLAGRWVGEAGFSGIPPQSVIKGRREVLLVSAVAVGLITEQLVASDEQLGQGEVRNELLD